MSDGKANILVLTGNSMSSSNSFYISYYVSKDDDEGDFKVVSFNPI